MHTRGTHRPARIRVCMLVTNGDCSDATILRTATVLLVYKARLTQFALHVQKLHLCRIHYVSLYLPVELMEVQGTGNVVQLPRIWEKPVEQPLTVFLHRNGDVFSIGKRSGKKFIFNQKQLSAGFEFILQQISNNLKLNQGYVKRLYATNGVQVIKVNELLNMSHYIACGPYEKFKHGVAHNRPMEEDTTVPSQPAKLIPSARNVRATPKNSSNKERLHKLQIKQEEEKEQRIRALMAKDAKTQQMVSNIRNHREDGKPHKIIERGKIHVNSGYMPSLDDKNLPRTNLQPVPLKKSYKTDTRIDGDKKNLDTENVPTLDDRSIPTNKQTSAPLKRTYKTDKRIGGHKQNLGADNVPTLAAKNIPTSKQPSAPVKGTYKAPMGMEKSVTPKPKGLLARSPNAQQPSNKKQMLPNDQSQHKQHDRYPLSRGEVDMVADGSRVDQHDDVHTQQQKEMLDAKRGRQNESIHRLEEETVALNSMPNIHHIEENIPSYQMDTTIHSVMEESEDSVDHESEQNCTDVVIEKHKNSTEDIHMAASDTTLDINQLKLIATDYVDVVVSESVKSLELTVAANGMAVDVQQELQDGSQSIHGRSQADGGSTTQVNITLSRVASSLKLSQSDFSIDVTDEESKKKSCVRTTLSRYMMRDDGDGNYPYVSDSDQYLKSEDTNNDTGNFSASVSLGSKQEDCNGDLVLSSTDSVDSQKSLADVYNAHSEETKVTLSKVSVTSFEGQAAVIVSNSNNTDNKFVLENTNHEPGQQPSTGEQYLNDQQENVVFDQNQYKIESCQLNEPAHVVLGADDDQIISPKNDNTGDDNEKHLSNELKVLVGSYEGENSTDKTQVLEEIMVTENVNCKPVLLQHSEEDNVDHEDIQICTDVLIEEHKHSSEDVHIAVSHTSSDINQPSQIATDTVNVVISESMKSLVDSYEINYFTNQATVVSSDVPVLEEVDVTENVECEPVILHSNEADTGDQGPIQICYTDVIIDQDENGNDASDNEVEHMDISHPNLDIDQLKSCAVDYVDVVLSESMKSIVDSYEIDYSTNRATIVSMDFPVLDNVEVIHEKCEKAIVSIDDEVCIKTQNQVKQFDGTKANNEMDHKEDTELVEANSNVTEKYQQGDEFRLESSKNSGIDIQYSTMSANIHNPSQYSPLTSKENSTGRTYLADQVQARRNRRSRVNKVMPTTQPTNQKSSSTARVRRPVKRN